MGLMVKVGIKPIHIRSPKTGILYVAKAGATLMVDNEKDFDLLLKANQENHDAENKLLDILPSNLVDKLATSGIVTLSNLHDYMNSHDLSEIPGIGEARKKEITEAISKWQ